jgi:hypothetical protein
LLELNQAKRVIATLGEAWDEARQHPKDVASIVVRTITVLGALAAETTRKPLVEFHRPSELSAFTPPEGFKLAGDYHIQKGAAFVISPRT